jgi:hypothetical protein
MDKQDKAILKVIAEIVISLGSLVAGITFIGLGTNLYIALGVFFLIMYYNSTRGDD